MKKISLFLLIALVHKNSIAQNVGIGTPNPHPSAALDINDTTRGLLPPRLTTTQRDAIANPASGLQIFNTTTNCLQMYVYGVWQNVFCGTNPMDSLLRVGLVGYWPFNGNANDESGNGNHGTVNGATLTTDRFGIANKAYVFNTNKFIEVPNSNSLNNPIGAISFWFKTSQASIQLMIYKCVINTAENENYAVGINAVNNNEVSFYVKYNSNCTPGVGWNICQSPNNYSDNNFHHFVGVYGVDSMYVYVDGLKKSSVPTPNSAADICQPSSLFFGRDWMSNQINNFKGTLDDIRIYNRALTQAEISYLANH